MADFKALAVRARAVTVAIPLSHVLETMRPLPTEAVGAMPPFVLGASVIRGAATPVVDLSAMLGGAKGNASRFVALKAGDSQSPRSVALAVEEVLQIVDVSQEEFNELPLLFSEADGAVISHIGSRDRELLVVLNAARIIPDDAGSRVEGEKDHS